MSPPNWCDTFRAICRDWPAIARRYPWPEVGDRNRHVGHLDNYVMSLTNFPRSAPVEITVGSRRLHEHSASICAELKKASFIIILGFTHILIFYSTVSNLLKKGCR